MSVSRPPRMTAEAAHHLAQLEATLGTDAFDTAFEAMKADRAMNAEAVAAVASRFMSHTARSAPKGESLRRIYCRHARASSTAPISGLGRKAGGLRNDVRRLDELPGVGSALATALVASVPDAKVFRSGCDFSVWIGLAPRQNSSGGKDRLGNITKQGDRYLRNLFTASALAVIRMVKIRGAKHRPWLGSCWNADRRMCLPTKSRAWLGQ